jgi:hypothetical protein
MAKKDLHNQISPVVALNIQAITTDTTTVGNEIDMQGFESITFIPVTGTITDGDYTIAITECDTTGGSFTAVADSDLLGTEANASFTDNTDDNKLGKVSYKGTKRYVKASIVSTSTSSGGTLGVVAVKGNPFIAPVAYTAP